MALVYCQFTLFPYQEILPDFTAGYADIVKCLLFISVQEVMSRLFYGHN